ncbi:NAC domain protein [Quillaja saponaria]|uniref:NAC domain protein n=1 Tax=Quillaja saponaria TaxID=32244 RepID=A0AAD7LJI3_QUISA|nr:NAC domain protein [Quillaja saponaria]
MGEPQGIEASWCASLPPGCRFYPSEEQLLCYYLANKNTNTNKDVNLYNYDLIRELDLYDHYPFELPEIACFPYGTGGRKRHWYCYTVRVLKETKGNSRKVKSGYWRRNGRVRDVLGRGGKVVLGTRTSFDFYLGNSKNDPVRTDWVLYEYALVDHLKASFVVCRVFVRSHHRNSISEYGMSSCAEGSVSAVRHIGKGYLNSVETKVLDDNSVDKKIEMPLYPTRLFGEQDDHRLITKPVSVASFQRSSGVQGNKQERLSGYADGEAITDQDLQFIVEENYIELDDFTD